MIICAFCIAKMDKVESKSFFMQLKSILYTNAEKYSVFCSIFLMSGNDQYGAAYCYEGIPLRFLASLFDMQMRYLMYMRYLWAMQ